MRSLNIQDRAHKFIHKFSPYLQYLLPKYLFTVLIYYLARYKALWFKNMLIKKFIKIFDVDMSLAKNPDPTSYANFNQFFTRELSATARPIEVNPSNILCPIDGSISQIGQIADKTIIQAKAKTYTLKSLLYADDLVETFADGIFATLYLAPRDYHRIHMPYTGQLTRMLYIPGRLFSVSTNSVRMIDQVFAKNERLLNIFNTKIGAMAMIMVGACGVRSMETVWAGEVTPAHHSRVSDFRYTADNTLGTQLQQGQEMGRFNMGSTVILLFQKSAVEWSANLAAEQAVTLGLNIGKVRN